MYKKTVFIRIAAALLAGLLLFSTGCTKQAQLQPAETLRPSETASQEEASSTPAGPSGIGAETPAGSAAPDETEPAEESPIVRVTGEGIAAELRASSEAYGFENALAELKPVSENKVDGDTIFRLQQYYSGLPVYGRSAVFVVDEGGNQIGSTGNLLDVAAGIDLTRELSEETIRNACAEYFGEAAGADGISVIPDITGTSRCIYNLFRHEPCLAYAVTACCSDLFYNVVISCPDGELLLCTPCQVADTADTGETVLCNGTDVDGNTVEFNTYKSDSDETYWLMDQERNLVVYDAGGERVEINVKFTGTDGEQYYSEDRRDMLGKEETVLIRVSDGEVFDLYAVQPVQDTLDWVLWKKGSNTPLEIPASVTKTWPENKDELVTVMRRTEAAYDFYKTVLNREGYDGNGSKMYIVSNNRDAKNVGAFSTTFSPYSLTMTSFFSNLEQDTIAHEYTHCVEASESGMTYQNESGAIMEALSDIFGELVEDYANDGALNGNCNWIHGERSMISPHDHGYPDTYHGKYWGRTFTMQENIDQNDFGHVHTNNTVISHTAFLMWSGGDETDDKRLSTAQLAVLWYRAMLMMPSDCDFKKCREIVELAAQTMGLTEDQLACVSEAFEQVGIPDMFGKFDYCVGPGSTLRVLDHNGSPYSDYACEMTGVQSKWPGLGDHSYAKFFPDNTTEPIPLPAKEGSYEICLYDKNEAALPVSFTLKIDLSQPAQELEIPTSFRVPEPIPMDWLTTHWFEMAIQSTQAFRFYPDGTVESYYIDSVRDASYLHLKESEYALYPERSGEYTVDKDKLQIRMNAEGDFPAWDFTLRYLKKSDHPEVRDWDTANLFPMDVCFLFEYGYEPNAGEDGDDTNRALYLFPVDGHGDRLVFGGRQDNTYSIDTASLVTDAYSESASFSDGSRSQTFEIKIPKVNLQSAEIAELNRSIYDELYPRAANAINKIRNNRWDFYSVNYQFARNGDILSLWDHSSYYSFPAEEWNIKNISISQKRAISKQELLEAYGISESEYQEKAKQGMVSLFLDRNQSVSTHSSYATLFTQQLRKTADSVNIDDARPYLDENGDLCIIARVYTLAEQDFFPERINLETFILSPYYEHYFGSDGSGGQKP